MKNIKLILMMLGASITLYGCGDDSSSTDSSTDNDTVTVTAIDGYLYKANIYQQDEDGICLTDEEPLATTDTNGQAQISLADLSDGYCVVATTDTIDQDDPDSTIVEAFTLYSPAPRLLGETSAPVISPLTNYISTSISEAGSSDETDILVTIETAKTDLISALGLDEDSNITDILTTDYVSLEENTDTNIAKAASTLHVMAQLLVQANDEDDAMSATQVVGIAQSAAEQISNIVDSDDVVANSELLDNIAVYVINNIDQFEYSNTPTSLDLSIIEAMPQQPETDGDLQTQLSALITTQAALTDNTSSLVLDDIDLTGLSSLADDTTYVLTKEKVGSIWPADSIADTSEPTSATFTGDTLTITELSFNQYGTYLFKLYAKSTVSIDGAEQDFLSKPITFTTEISEEQVANTAPVFDGIESENAVTLLADLDTAAQDESAFFDWAIYGLDKPVEFSFKVKNTELNALFTDDSTQTLTVDKEVNNDDFDGFGIWDLPFITYIESSDLYTVNSNTFSVPESGSDSYRVTLYATDDLGAKSESGFEFTITVNSDLTASVTATDGTATDDGSDSEVEYGEAFNGVLIPSSYLTTLETQVAAYLNGETPDSDPALEQVLPVYSYQCDTESTCVQGDGLTSGYELSGNTYLTIDSSVVGNTILAASSESVTEKQTIILTPSVDSESVKIYEVESRTSTSISGIDEFKTQVQLVINPDTGSGVTVTASLID